MSQSRITVGDVAVVSERDVISVALSPMMDPERRTEGKTVPGVLRTYLVVDETWHAVPGDLVDEVERLLHLPNPEPGLLELFHQVAPVEPSGSDDRG